MPIKVKKGGAYSDASVFVKKGGVYAAAQVFAKAAGAYALASISLNSGPLMFSSNRQGNFTQYTAASASNVYQVDFTSYDSPPYDIVCPRLVFAGIYCNATGNYEQPLGNDVLFQGVVIEIAGTRYPLTVGGSSSFTVTNGSWAITDENTIVIPANTRYRIGVATNVAAGQYRLTPSKSNATEGDAYKTGTTDVSSYLTSGTLSTGTGTFQVAPVMQVARGWLKAGKPPVPLVMGDSIGWGKNEDMLWNEVPMICGFINRALNDNASSTRYPYCNLCVPSANFYDGTKFSVRGAILAALNYPFTSIISEMGINASNGAQAVTLWPAWGTFLKTLGNKPVLQTTMLPRAIGALNLGGTSLAGQTKVDFSAYNTFIRNHADANISGHIDMGGIVEPTLDDGRWLVPSYTSTVAAAYTYGDSTITLTDRPNIGDSLIVDPGLSTYKLLGPIYAISGTGPYVASLRKGATGSFAVGAVVAAQITNDLLHPLTPAALMLMAPVIAAKNAGVIV